MTPQPQQRPDAVTTLPSVAYISLPVRVLSTGDRRLEGETYLTGGYVLRFQIERAGIPVRYIHELADIWQPSRLKGIEVTKASGTQFLTATQVFDILPSPRKWLSAKKTPSLGKRYVEPGWIIVTRSGSVGDAMIAYSPHVGAIISDDLLRVQVKNLSDLGYLYTYLRSRYGRQIVRSSRYGKIIKHLEVEHLQEVPVPILGDSLRGQLDERIRQVFRLRDEAFLLTQKAETLYSKAFGADKVQEADETAFGISASEMFGGRRRLDGYHYNPSAEAALVVLKSSGRMLQSLSELTERIFGVPRFKHVYSDQGIPYLDSEDIFKVNPEITKFIPEVTKKNAARYYVGRGWLLMACSGQLYGLNGSVILATRWHENKIVSNHVIRIVPRSESDGLRPGYLQLALGHPTLGRPLVLRLAFGMEVPEISPDDLKGFPVPRLQKGLENQIADLVERASEMRLQADEEESAVVQSFEEELERVLRMEPRVTVVGRSLRTGAIDERLKPLSLHSLTPEQALSAPMKADPEKIKAKEWEEQERRKTRKTPGRNPQR